MTFNQAGLDLLKSFEGCKLEAYKDIAGVVTIGYGATGKGVSLGDTWTQEQAEERLKSDLEAFSEGVYDLLEQEVTENQFSALVCFAYNVGLAALYRSTLLKYVNSGRMQEAADQFPKWNKAGGRAVKGLTRRRLAERDLFLS